MPRKRPPDSLQRPYSNDMAKRRHLTCRSDYARQRGKQRPKKHISRYLLLFLVIFTLLFSVSVKESTTEPISSNPEIGQSDQVPLTVIELESLGEFTIYAYNSVPEQTDASPCISADNKNICERFANGEKLCASNDFPLGTIITIGDLGEFKVVDRMRSDYRRTIDIFMGDDIAKAKQFGKKTMTVFASK